MITADEIERLLISKFRRLAMWMPPFGKKIFSFDVYYALPPLEKLEEYLFSTKVSSMKYVEYLNDCDDYALHFLSEVRKKVIEEDIEIHQYAIGRCFLQGDNIVIPHHMANIAITDMKDIYILDAMDRKIKAADKSDDIRLVIM